ncbi:MAG: acyl-CoA carboxylase subunit beta, partial [Chitinophagaceae bacterium]
MKLAVSAMRQRHAIVRQGGGKKSMEKAAERGKMSPRERINYLIDEGTQLQEIGSFAGWEMYEKE